MTNDTTSGWDDGVEETAEDLVQVAEAMLVLAEMARERGLDRIADLGDLPPLDPETKAKYLARARARREASDGD
jgi:hypothetical protein